MTRPESMKRRVQRFIEYKRGLGYAWRTEGFVLRSFAEFADKRAPREAITVALALAWATSTRKANSVYHAKRLDAVRTFAKHEAELDPRTQVPPPGVLGPSYSRVEPYIYSPREVTSLMRTAATLSERGLRRATYVTVIGLLASTGIRIGELLKLNDDDVDLAQSLLRVRGSKNLPLRTVPIARSTTRNLSQYKALRDERLPTVGARAFVRGRNGKRMLYTNVQRSFRRIVAASGIGQPRDSMRAPRMHDLRHTFACNHLLRAYREGRDIDAAVHDLSVYLGHATLTSTYWYLTGTPMLFAECIKRLKGRAPRSPTRGRQ